MPEPDVADPEPHWDDVVDVICVGAGPGLLAYGLCCAAADLDVLRIDAPAAAGTVLTAFMAAMTEDLEVSATDRDTETSIPAVTPELSPTGRGVKLEPFVGPQLRDWSALCLGSPSGVLLTEVSDVLAPMRTEDGDLIAAAVLGGHRGPLGDWLRAEADDQGLAVEGRLADLVVEDGRIAGAVIDTDSGPWRVAARAGIALAVGPEQDDPAGPDGGDLEVAVVGRPFGRFARVQWLRR